MKAELYNPSNSTYRASARKTGRNPQWPFVPVVICTPGDGSRGHTTQPRGKAFATREEAVAYADRYIDVNRMPR